MTVDATADTPTGVRRAWPAWQVPAHATGEWLQLVDALERLGDSPACADEPERWWSKTPADVSWAQLGCTVCPVVSWCRAYALAAGEREGVWGGLSPLERRDLGRVAL